MHTNISKKKKNREYKMMSILASSSLPNQNPSSSSPPNPSKDSKPTPLRRISLSPLQQKRKQKKPSVIEIERAIGTGLFKDRDPSDSDSGRNKTMFDVILSNSIGKTEGTMERKLRETGEWLLKESESSSSSFGKQVLIGMFVLIIPMGLFLLVASGIIKLPFSNAYLDDLIM